MQPHILVVDDDTEIRTLVGKYLAGQGFRIATAGTARECDAALSDGRFDLVVLDVMLPDGSGLDICKGLSERRPAIPVILLTALKEDVDRIVGLELGADDYLPKPFNPRELTARIRAVLRRTGPAEPPEPQTGVYRFAGLVCDPSARSVTGPSGDLDLTPAEFDLLWVFLDRPGRLLSRDALFDLTGRKPRDPEDRALDVLMSRLRRKLGEAGAEAAFKTVRGGGYQLTVPVETQPA